MVWWQWVFSIVGAVAFVMYLVPMILGRPKVSVWFGVSDDEEGRILNCKIMNEPLTNKTLVCLGIRRLPVEDMMAHLSIMQGDKLITTQIPQIWLYNGRANAKRVKLAASYTPAAFGIVTALFKNKDVRVYEDESIVLPFGLYNAYVRVTVDGRHIERWQDFEVVDSHPFVYWRNEW
jgi:hypothetical protein